MKVYDSDGQPFGPGDPMEVVVMPLRITCPDTGEEVTNVLDIRWFTCRTVIASEDHNCANCGSNIYVVLPDEKGISPCRLRKIQPI